MLAPMRTLACACALLSVSLLLGCPTPQERSETAREDARQALARRDRVAALKAIHTLRQLEPDTPQDVIELAELLVLAGEAPEALRVLERGLDRWPDDDALRVPLARVALLVSNPSAARAALLEVGPDAENHVTALVLRAQAELRLGNFDRAVEILGEAEELYPDAPEARIARIGALLNEARFEDAREALEAARPALVAAGSEQTLVGFELELLRAQSQEDPEGTLEGLRELAEAHPDDPRVWQAMVFIMARTGRGEESAELLAEAIEENPDRFFLYPPLAAMRQASGDGEGALALLRELIDRSASPTAYLVLAQFLSNQPDREGATLAALQEGLEAFPDDPQLLRADAEAKLALSDLGAARAAVETFRERQPDDPNREYLQARLELAEGNSGAAVQRLTSLMPRLDLPVTQHWLGRALEADGDLQGATRRYRLALQRDPNDVGLYPALIGVEAQRGNWREVSHLGERMTRIAPQREEGWSAWASGLVQLGDGARAEPVARRYADLFPESGDAQLTLVRGLRAAGHYDEALEALDAAQPLVEDAAQLEAEKALTLGLSGRLAEGIALVREASATHPDSAAVHLTAASLLFAAGQAEEGARAAERALELDPDDPQPLALRARFRAATGRLEGAREDCERYLALRPDDPAIHFVLGAVHDGAGRSDEAIAAYRRAAELDPEAFAPRNNLAYLLADRDLDAALVAAQEAYALSPDPAVLDTLGWLYLRKGLVDRATSLLEKAHAEAPQLAEVQLHLALAHREAGRKDDARQLLVALAAREDTPQELEAQVQDALRSLE